MVYKRRELEMGERERERNPELEAKISNIRGIRDVKSKSIFSP
jgi:hypothetical protein